MYVLAPPECSAPRHMYVHVQYKYLHTSSIWRETWNLIYGQKSNLGPHGPRSRLNTELHSV